MKIDFKKEDNNLIITLVGELGNFEARHVMGEIDTILAVYKKEDVILDLKGLTFMDSSGIAVVMKMYKTTKDIRNFTVLNTPNLANKIFSTAGVSKFINIC